jgi:bifunctional non-homologous end joining protein LigD
MSDRLRFIEPMMPTLVDKPPVQGEWSVEVKFDGWRCQLVIDADGARVFTRRGHDWTVRLKIIADAATNELVQMNGMKKVKSAIIDGELVYPHVSGRSDFHALQAVVRSHSDKLIFMAFDLLHLNGEDTRSLPLEGRRERLRNLIPAGGRIQFSEALEGTPEALFAAAERMRLEGIVCKRRGSLYRSGNAFDWVKVKCFVETELELLGVQRALGKPTIALMGEPGTRNYVGSAFVRFGRPASEAFWSMVEANLGPPPSGFKIKPRDQVQWLVPGVIGRIRHLRNEDKLRHATLVSAIAAQSGFYDI